MATLLGFFFLLVVYLIWYTQLPRFIIQRDSSNSDSDSTANGFEWQQQIQHNVSANTIAIANVASELNSAVDDICWELNETETHTLTALESTTDHIDSQLSALSVSVNEIVRELVAAQTDVIREEMREDIVTETERFRAMVEEIVATAFETQINRFFDTSTNWIRTVVSKQSPINWRSVVNSVLGGGTTATASDTFELRDIRLNGRETCLTLAPGDCYVFAGRTHSLELHLRMPIYVSEFEYVHANKKSLLMNEEEDGDGGEHELWRTSPKTFVIQGQSTAASSGQWHNLISDGRELAEMSLDVCSLVVPLRATEKVDVVRVQVENWGAESISVYRMRIRGGQQQQQQERGEQTQTED